MTTNSWLSGGPLPEVLDEFVDQIWSSLISKGGGQHLAGVDAKRSEKESQEKDEAEFVLYTMRCGVFSIVNSSVAERVAKRPRRQRQNSPKFWSSGMQSMIKKRVT